jgi:hypothetical protein
MQRIWKAGTLKWGLIVQGTTRRPGDQRVELISKSRMIYRRKRDQIIELCRIGTLSDMEQQ